MSPHLRTLPFVNLRGTQGAGFRRHYTATVKFAVSPDGYPFGITEFGARGGGLPTRSLPLPANFTPAWRRSKVQLRKRAFTAAWEHGIDPRKAAIAIGCNADPVMKHYVRLDEQAVTDEVMGQLAPLLEAPKLPRDEQE